jgi:hypothetical protein
MSAAGLLAVRMSTGNGNRPGSQTSKPRLIAAARAVDGVGVVPQRNRHQLSREAAAMLRW